MFAVASRVKTNGSYTTCATMDTNCSNYGNKIEDVAFADVKTAVGFIIANGDKSRMYYICAKYDSAFDAHSRNNKFLDAGNDWFVRQRYSYTNGKWTRICLTTSKPYSK